MGAILNDNFQTEFPKPLDGRYGPYGEISEALEALPLYRRFKGLTIAVGLTELIEYWWYDGIDDNSLVIKSSGSGAPSGTLDIDGGTFLEPGGGFSFDGGKFI